MPASLVVIALKVWILAMWWVIWKARNDFLFKRFSLNTINVVLSVKSLCEGPIVSPNVIAETSEGESCFARVIFNEENALIISDIAYRASYRKSYGTLMILLGFILNEGVIQERAKRLFPQIRLI